MKWMLTALLAACLAGSSFAQNTKEQGPDPAAEAERMTARMTQELSLSPDQASAVKAINLKYLEKVLANKEQGLTLNKADIMASMEQELEGVLTAAQFERMEQLRTTRTTPDGRTIKEVQPVE